MDNLISYWVDKLVDFDFWTEYADDYRTHSRGREAKNRLRAEIRDAGLSKQDKELIANESVARKPELANILSAYLQ